jgi:nitric oxide reductase subunit B
MRYATQRIAYPYIVVGLLLFLLQVVLGLWLGLQYAWTAPQGVVDAFPFSTARAMHTNLLVLWLLLGFMGATFYVVPEEAERELAWPRLAIAQLVLLVGTGVAALVGFLFGWTQGRPLLEIPVPLDLLVVVGALMFLANVGVTFLRARRWTAVQGSLLGGLVFLAVLYLFGIPFYRNLSLDWFYWWWVIHLWVEGAWELITAALMAFVLIKLTGVDRAVVEKWLYVELGLFLFTGIAGTGHHYHWLGAPRAWLWVGGVFSALEPLPIMLMLVDTWRATREGMARKVPAPTWTYLVGIVLGRRRAARGRADARAAVGPAALRHSGADDEPAGLGRGPHDRRPPVPEGALEPRGAARRGRGRSRGGLAGGGVPRNGAP